MTWIIPLHMVDRQVRPLELHGLLPWLAARAWAKLAGFYLLEVHI